jgi:hypothetical protein
MADEREQFAMVPSSVILGRLVRNANPRTQTTSDALGMKLYAFVDLQPGRTWRRGYRDAAKELGWQERTVSTTARRLAEAGLIAIEERGGHESTVLRIAHNPARDPQIINPKVDVSERSVRAGHARRQPPAERQAKKDTLSRDTRQGSTDRATPVASDAPSRVVRESPPASDASRSALHATGVAAPSAPMGKALRAADPRARVSPPEELPRCPICHLAVPGPRGAPEETACCSCTFDDEARAVSLMLNAFPDSTVESSA